MFDKKYDKIIKELHQLDIKLDKVNVEISNIGALLSGTGLESKKTSLKESSNSKSFESKRPSNAYANVVLKYRVNNKDYSHEFKSFSDIVNMGIPSATVYTNKVGNVVDVRNISFHSSEAIKGLFNLAGGQVPKNKKMNENCYSVKVINSDQVMGIRGYFPTVKSIQNELGISKATIRKFKDNGSDNVNIDLNRLSTVPRTKIINYLDNHDFDIEDNKVLNFE